MGLSTDPRVLCCLSWLGYLGVGRMASNTRNELLYRVSIYLRKTARPTDLLVLALEVVIAVLDGTAGVNAGFLTEQLSDRHRISFSTRKGSSTGPERCQQEQPSLAMRTCACSRLHLDPFGSCAELHEVTLCILPGALWPPQSLGVSLLWHKAALLRSNTVSCVSAVRHLILPKMISSPSGAGSRRSCVLRSHRAATERCGTAGS